MLSDFLIGRGHAVWAANNGPEALALVRRRRFDAVLLDIMMPGMDGIETLRRLKEEAPAVIVIMISGTTNERAASESLALGAYDFIGKPIDLATLESVLATALAMRA